MAAVGVADVGAHLAAVMLLVGEGAGPDTRRPALRRTPWQACVQGGPGAAYLSADTECGPGCLVRRRVP